MILFIIFWPELVKSFLFATKIRQNSYPLLSCSNFVPQFKRYEVNRPHNHHSPQHERHILSSILSLVRFIVSGSSYENCDIKLRRVWRAESMAAASEWRTARHNRSSPNGSHRPTDIHFTCFTLPSLYTTYACAEALFSWIFMWIIFSVDQQICNDV